MAATVRRWQRWPGELAIYQLWTIELQFSAEEFDALQPAVGGFGFAGGTPPAQDEKERCQSREAGRDSFNGTDFPWLQR